jgi:hypothetical protein
MRDARMREQLGALAEHLDEAAPPLDVEAILTAPRRAGSGRRGLHAVAAAAAAMVILIAIGVARPDPPEERQESVVTNSEARVEIVGATEPIVDGQTVTVAGRGFRPDAEVHLRQCAPAGCDDWRAPVPVTADGDGRCTAQMIAYRDIATGRGTEPADPLTPDWFACSPCQLQATATSAASATPRPDDAHAARAAVPISVASSSSAAEPLHPNIRITTPGPHRTGQRVAIEGSGFQPDPEGLGVTVAYCPAGAQRAEECGGGPELGDLAIGPDGRFAIESFELPTTDANLGGTRCTDESGACVITWLLTTPGPLPLGTPLDLPPGPSTLPPPRAPIAAAAARSGASCSWSPPWRSWRRLSAPP